MFVGIFVVLAFVVDGLQPAEEKERRRVARQEMKDQRRHGRVLTEGEREGHRQLAVEGAEPLITFLGVLAVAGLVLFLVLG